MSEKYRLLQDYLISLKISHPLEAKHHNTKTQECTHKYKDGNKQICKEKKANNPKFISLKNS